MLVLSRRKNQDIVCKHVLTGERIEIKVVEIRGNSVRIGLTAPDHIMIFRKEASHDWEKEDDQNKIEGGNEGVSSKETKADSGS